MTWTIHIQSENFPKYPLPYAQCKSVQLSFTKIDLLWAAITVGRPDKIAVRQHAHWSRHEAIFRWHMVLANLDFGCVGEPLSYSPAFHALDATEKAGVNFFLGMMFAKLIAYKQLGVPWLHHFDNFKITNTVTKLPGNSKPDFVGLHANGDWHIIEAKARVKGLRKDALVYGKKQAQMVQTVNKSVPKTAIGALLFPQQDELHFQWEDPYSVEEGGLELTETVEVWQSYYRLPLALYDLKEDEKKEFEAIAGFEVSISKDILEAVKGFFDPPENWERHRKIIVEWSKKSKENGDGITVSLIEKRA